MAKDILAFFGMIFLIILIVVGVSALAIFYDRIGIISLPQGMKELVDAYTPSSGTVTVREIGVGKAEWSNPLDAIPTATMTMTPVPTATQVPPLAPEVYQTDVLLYMKSFVSALERWLDLNEALTRDNSLLSDAGWQTGMRLALENVSETSRALASVGPAPEEYKRIDQWLDRVDQEAQGMRASYLMAIENQADLETSTKQFTAASSHFVRIKEYLFQAVDGMIAAGWTF
jgi:hypothetical protein